MFELQENLKKRDSEIESLKRQVNGEYNQVGKRIYLSVSWSDRHLVVSIPRLSAPTAI